MLSNLMYLLILLISPQIKMSQEIKTKSGISINPIGSIQDLLSGTSFQEDAAAQGHLKSLGDAFHEIGQSEEGQIMLTAMEGLAGRIKTETSFKDGVKVCFRLEEDNEEPLGTVRYVHWTAGGSDWSLWDS